MATHKSAIKRHKQSLKRHERNIAVKSAIKTLTKKTKLAIEEKDIENAQSFLQRAIRLINKAASKGIIHKNNAARRISRLTKRVNTLSSTSTS